METSETEPKPGYAAAHEAMPERFSDPEAAQRTFTELHETLDA